MTKAKIKELSDNRYREDSLRAEGTVKHQAEVRHEGQQRLLEHDLHNKSELVRSRQRQGQLEENMLHLYAHVVLILTHKMSLVRMRH